MVVVVIQLFKNKSNLHSKLKDTKFQLFNAYITLKIKYLEKRYLIHL